MYYLYSIKMNGWITKGGSYVDDVSMAAEWDVDQMRYRVRTHYDTHSKAWMLIPVPAWELKVPT